MTKEETISILEKCIKETKEMTQEEFDKRDTETEYNEFGDYSALEKLYNEAKNKKNLNIEMGGLPQPPNVKEIPIEDPRPL